MNLTIENDSTMDRAYMELNMVFLIAEIRNIFKIWTFAVYLLISLAFIRLGNKTNKVEPQD